MPLGKQAAAGIFSFFFPDSCGKVQDAPPNPFSVFFPPALSIGSAFNEHYSHLLQKKWEFCIPIPFGIGGKDGATPLQKCIGA